MTFRELRKFLFDIEEQDEHITDINFSNRTPYIFVTVGEGEKEKIYRMEISE